MIVAPKDWTQHNGAHLVTLYPPGGGGRIRYYERIPLQPFSAVIRHVLDRDPHFRAQSVINPRDFITSEGEYGAWTRINGSREGSPAVRYVGAVFPDEFAAALDALVVVPEKRGLIEHTAQDLLVNTQFYRLLCGRRCRYTPPPDWWSIPNGLVANWYPPDFPGNNTNIVVFPARPNAPGATEEFEGMLRSDEAAGTVLDGEIREQPVIAASGLEGRHWSVASRPANRDHNIYRDFFSFSEPPFSYTVRMESLVADRIDEHRAIAAAVARSIQPIPRATRRFIGPMNPTSTVDAFGHWDD